MTTPTDRDSAIAQAIAALEKGLDRLPTPADWEADCKATGMVYSFPAYDSDPVRNWDTGLTVGDLRTALASLRALAPAPADQSDAGRNAVIEECAKIAADFSEEGRFTVPDTWRNDMTPTQVYQTAATDVGGWIAKDICALTAGRGEENKPRGDTGET